MTDISNSTLTEAATNDAGTVRVWVLSTCVPSESTPCIPSVFFDEAAALAEFREMMAREWENNGPETDDGELMPCPADPYEANRLMADNCDQWGEWELTSHLLPLLAAPPAPSVFVATYQHKHGSDCQVFASADGAESWRQAIANDYWDGFIKEDAPADAQQKADRYFERSEEIGDEFFEVVETAIHGSFSPAAPASGIDWCAVARDLASALNSCTHQIEQMRGMFGDEDGTIAEALEDAGTAAATYAAAVSTSPAAPASSPAPRTVWTCATEGDNCPLTVTVHATLQEAEERARADLRADCRESQRAHLNTLSGTALREAWEEKNDGPCAIEEHDLNSGLPVTPSPSCETFAAYEAAIIAVKRCAAGEIERPLTERAAWPGALVKLTTAIRFAPAAV